MLSFGFGHRYYLYRQAADMRKSFDGLSGLVRDGMGRDPQSGDVYLFVNKRRDRIKLLVWDRSGYWLYYKRLEKGSFQAPSADLPVAGVKLGYDELVMILEGIDLASVRRRQRYKSGRISEKEVG